MTDGGAVDRWAEALFDLWEGQLAQIANSTGLKGFADLWPAEPMVGEAVAQSLGQMTELQARAADVFKLWLVALTGHALTANVQAPAPQGDNVPQGDNAPQGVNAPQGAKSGNIDGRRPADASQQSQDSADLGPGQPPGGKGKRQGRQGKRAGRAKSGKASGAPRTQTARAASGKRGPGVEQPARRAAGARRRPSAVAAPARGSSRKTPRKPSRR